MVKDLVVDAHLDGVPNKKTGTMLTAVMHIFCGIVGAGVLALPRSLAWLGWVAGPILLIAFWLIALLTSLLLADAYEVNGVEHGRYHLAVRTVLGPKYAISVSIFQLADMFLLGIAYTITGVTSMVSIAKLHCAGAGITNCMDQTWELTLIFGAATVVLSQVPSLEDAWWVSSLGVITSLTYSIIALALGIKYAGAHLGSVGGISTNSVNKAFGILGSLGAIAFAYSFALILLEIQDTLRQPPKASKTMKPAAAVGISMSFVFYFTVAVTNYSAFGNDVPGFILNAYPGPTWVIMLGQVCIMLHMLSAYQVFSQPMFDTLESHIKAFALCRARANNDIQFQSKIETLRRTSAAARAARTGQPPPAVDVETDPVLTANLELNLDNKPPAAQGISAKELPTGLHRVSAAADEVGRLSAQSSMYRVSTGFVNEVAPLNEDHYYIPLWQRLIVRTLYVGITTLIAIVMPFFGDMAGLVGALTFFPLSIFFPIRMWRRLYKVSPRFNVLLWFIEIGLGLTSVAATVASVRNIIIAWSTYKIFGE